MQVIKETILKSKPLTLKSLRINPCIRNYVTVKLLCRINPFITEAHS